MVPGNRLNTDGSVHPNLAHRLTAATELAIARPAAPVVVSGGTTPDGHVEDRADSTVTNARYSRQLLPAATSVIVVTSESHLRRTVDTSRWPSARMRR